MRMYTIHEKEGAKAASSDVVLVREGFSVWALLFPPLWALIHRMWPVAFGLLAIYVALALFSRLVSGGDAWADLGVLAVMLLVGFFAGDLRQWALKLKGYELTGVVGGRSLADAEHRYFSVVGPGYL